MADPVSIVGTDVTIRGNLSGDEDLAVAGTIEGTVALTRHLSVEPTGVVLGDVEVEDLTVQGRLEGEIVATHSVSITTGATVVGNVTAPQVAIEEGAHFDGHVEMEVELPPGVPER